MWAIATNAPTSWQKDVRRCLRSHCPTCWAGNIQAIVITRLKSPLAQDWSLTDDELETVMQRLDDAFVYGACDRVVSDIVNELMEEKRASRHVTVPAVMLEKVMALAGSEMKRLYAVGSENGGDGDAFVREEREAMDVVLQALDGETMS